MPQKFWRESLPLSAHPMGKRASVSTTRLTTEAAQVTSPPTPPVPLQDTLVTQKRTGLAAWLRNSGKRLAGLSDQGQFLFLWGAVAPPLGSGPSITSEPPPWESKILTAATMRPRNGDRASPAKADVVKTC